MDAIRLTNVRSIREMPFVPLRPLTILVGRNSVGKSSFIRWLPLLSQSLGAPGSAPILWTRRDRGLVDYGSFHETLRRGSDPQEIGFSWQGSLDGLSYEATSTLATFERATYVARLTIDIGDVHVLLRCGPTGGEVDLSINGQPASTLAEGWDWSAAQSEIVPRLKPNPIEAGSPSPGHKERLARLIELKTRKMDAWRLVNLSERVEGWTTRSLRMSLASSNSGTPTWSRDLKKVSDDDGRLRTLLPYYAIRDVSRLVSKLLMQVLALLSSLVYVAPFRAEPRRAERSPEPSSTLDPRGDALLNFAEGLRPDELKSLSEWLSTSLGFKLLLRKEGLYSELRIDQGAGGDDNLADVGYGIGQVLPVAVHLWKAGQGGRRESTEGSLVVMEQPELHLHPAAQSRVGRMLVRHAAGAIDHRGRVLVETHSEALINAVGEEVGAGRIRRGDVRVVVFERTSTREDVGVRVVEFDEKGYLQPPWPFDFFAG